MSDPALKIDVAEWVERARDDPVAYRQRQTVEITLNAIAMTAPLNAEMFLKGGILMGLAYGSPRLTADIDLTTNRPVDSNVGEMIQTSLDSAFPRAAAVLGYADLVVKTHSVKEQPKKVGFENADFPALKLKIAYAQRGTPQEKALQQGKTPGVIDVDISFNEPLTQIQVLELTGGRELRAYGLVELIAEKYRAMLQQDQRGRNRRQDVYDLDQLIAGNEIDDACREQILDVFIAKCRSRGLESTRASLDKPEIKKRSGADWQTMGLELGEVPDFEGCFVRVSKFYRNLPWGGVMSYQYEFDETESGTLELTREHYETLNKTYRQLCSELRKWNQQVVKHGASEGPYEREVRDLTTMIEWSDDRLAGFSNAIFAEQGVSIGSVRYAKAALVLLIHRRREDRVEKSRQEWPGAALRSLDEAIERIEEIVNVISQHHDASPSDVLWELIPKNPHPPPVPEAVGATGKGNHVMSDENLKKQISELREEVDSLDTEVHERLGKLVAAHEEKIKRLVERMEGAERRIETLHAEMPIIRSAS